MLVPLTRGRFAIIDAADAPAVSQRNWTAIVRKGTKTVYASTEVRLADDTRSTISLHVFLWKQWGLPPAPEVDHKDGDGLNCTRGNLRSATSSQNKHNTGKRRTNTSGYKCVYWDKRRRLWLAQIVVEGKQKYLGHFADPRQASDAYAEAAARLVGEFARAS